MPAEATCPVCQARGPYIVRISQPDADALAAAWADEPGTISVLSTMEITPVLPGAVRELLKLLRSPVMARMLDRVREKAEADLPSHESSAANPELYHRPHYARMAEECREEIAAIDALRVLVAEFGGGR